MEKKIGKIRRKKIERVLETKSLKSLDGLWHMASGD